jgi:hypothetical protein
MVLPLMPSEEGPALWLPLLGDHSCTHPPAHHRRHHENVASLLPLSSGPHQGSLPHRSWLHPGFSAHGIGTARGRRRSRHGLHTSALYLDFHPTCSLVAEGLFTRSGMFHVMPEISMAPLEEHGIQHPSQPPDRSLESQGSRAPFPIHHPKPLLGREDTPQCHWGNRSSTARSSILRSGENSSL